MKKRTLRQAREDPTAGAEDLSAGVSGRTDGSRPEMAPWYAEPVFRALAEAADALIFIVQGTRFRYVNPAMERIMGYSQEELREVDFWETVHPDFREMVKERGMARQRGEQVPSRYEFKGLTKSGEERWFDVSVALAEFEGKPAVVGAAFDITERRQAEEARRQAEARNSALLEAIPDMLFRVNREGVYLEFVHGKGIEPLLPPSEFLGKRMDEVGLPPDVVEKSACYIDRALQTGETQEYDYQLAINEEVRHYEARIVPSAKDEVLAIVRDVTGRKGAEEALRDSQERYRELVENVNDVVYEVDTEGRITYVSPIATEVFGYSPAEVAGRSIADFTPPEEVAARMDAFREGLAGGPIPAEFSLVSKSGEIRWIHTFGRVMREGERVIGFRGVLTDITERKRAEEALRHGEERYRALYEDNPSMYFTVDSQGTVLSVNRFGAEQLGYTADELVGQSVLKVFHKADKNAVQEQLSMCLRRATEVADWEFRKVRKDGSILWVKEAARAVRGPDGDMIVLIVCEDITQRKKAEEALQEAREELESRVEGQMQGENPYGLTFRELTALYLVAEGKSDKEIATLLGISPRTANKHLENILGKMGASSRTEAGVRAVREGLLRR